VGGSKNDSNVGGKSQGSAKYSGMSQNQDNVK